VRIGIVSDYYYPQLGGITEHAYGQASELSRRGHEVSLITPHLLRVPKTVDPAPPRHEPFEVIRVGRAYPFYINASETLLTVGPRLAFDVGRLFSKHSFDVLHVHNPFGVSLPIISIARSRARVTVGTIHSVVPEPLPCLITEKRNVLFVGRFDPRNGLKEMLRAFVLLRERRDDVRLIVLGDGPLRPLYERMVPPALREDVLFEGRVDGLRPRYLASSEILCTPCHLASFGMVVLEAMSAGISVVASNIPGFRQLMQGGVQGLLVDHDGTGTGFCEALDYLLEHPEAGRDLGRAGRERALEAFSWPVIADQLEELYERLLCGHPPARAAQT
jgi:phosphatidyl-myo-inositol alpha-mannosyltransferase